MKVKVKDISVFKNVEEVEIIDCIDSLDGGEKTYHATVLSLDEENNILELCCDNQYDMYSCTTKVICPKVYQKCDILD